MTTALALRETLGSDVINYQQLVNALTDYKKPRDKISRMLERGELIRLRKGLYVFEDQWRKNPIDHFHLANLIYGPSYVSYESALSHYGLIPERVLSITSATTGKNKKFTTPLGLFTYQRQQPFYYQEGMSLVERSCGNILMATPEKALCDQLLRDGVDCITTQPALKAYLNEDLRVDLKILRNLKLGRLKKIARASEARLIDLLSEYIKKIKG